VNPELEKLEHLISRALDGECTSDERKLLKSRLRNDPQARALFDELRTLDEALGDALRRATRRTWHIISFRSRWGRVGQGLIVTAAACLAAMAWLHPTPPKAGPARPTRSIPAQASLTPSWFAPSPPPADEVTPIPSAYERPQLRVRGTQRNWIVIPGDRPGTFMVIEVDRVRTHVIDVHRDF
jgi:hypothetical protein